MKGENKMKCKKCGTEVEWIFCSICGEKLEQDVTLQTDGFYSRGNEENGSEPQWNTIHKNNHKKRKKPIYKRLWFKILVCIFGFYAIMATIIHINTRPEKIDWDEIVLSEMLPEPKQSKVEIYDNSSSYLSVYVPKSTLKDYTQYANECRKMGYTIDSEEDDNSYYAYNSEGYYLTLYYYDDEIRIKLKEPMDLKEIEWPKGEIGKMLPKPKSNMGEVYYEYSDSFSVCIGNTSISDYKKYVNKCIENGFDVDYDKGEDYYRAYNSTGWYLSLKYEGFDTVSIRLEKKDDEETTTESTTETTTEVATEKVTTTEATTRETEQLNGIRPEFKEFMDSYEAFYEEYCEFLTGYAENSYNYKWVLEYASLTEKAEEMDDKLDEWDEEDLSTEEWLYFYEVTSRIYDMLDNID